MDVGTQVTEERQSDVRSVENHAPQKRNIFSCAVQDQGWKFRLWKVKGYVFRKCICVSRNRDDFLFVCVFIRRFSLILYLLYNILNYYIGTYFTTDELYSPSRKWCNVKKEFFSFNENLSVFLIELWKW